MHVTSLQKDKVIEAYLIFRYLGSQHRAWEQKPAASKPTYHPHSCVCVVCGVCVCIGDGESDIIDFYFRCETPLGVLYFVTTKEGNLLEPDHIHLKYL
jgi:hypothetical protein